MESEKLEDLLLLSLSASKGQRERSEVLDVGVTRDKNLREVIVKYSGDIDGLQIPGMEIQKLLAGYAIAFEVRRGCKCFAISHIRSG